MLSIFWFEWQLSCVEILHFFFEWYQGSEWYYDVWVYVEGIKIFKGVKNFM